MSFLYIAYDVFPSIALHTTFCRVRFRFVQTTVFLLTSLLHFMIVALKLFLSTLISYILFWCIMSTMLKKMLNQFLYFLQFSVISFVFLKIEHGVKQQQGNLSSVSTKTAPKQTGELIGSIFSFPEIFHASSNYQSIVHC